MQCCWSAFLFLQVAPWDFIWAWGPCRAHQPGNLRVIFTCLSQSNFSSKPCAQCSWHLWYLGNLVMLTVMELWPCLSSVLHFISLWPGRMVTHCLRACPQLCSQSTCKQVRPHCKSYTLGIFCLGLIGNFCFLSGVQTLRESFLSAVTVL